MRTNACLLPAALPLQLAVLRMALASTSSALAATAEDSDANPGAGAHISDRLDTRSVTWYTAAADTRQLADEQAVATGVYSCCGRIQLAANGSLSSAGVAELAKKRL